MSLMIRRFEDEHAAWWEEHRAKRTGERRDRMNDGQGYLEKRLLQQAWWPMSGTLEGLHPEYEVRDLNDGYRYIDLAYLPQSAKLAIETDGYASHVSQVSRRRHGDLSLRDLHLAADGWTVLHISSELIETRPRQVQQALQQIIWRHTGKGPREEPGFSPDEREIIRWCRLRREPITPRDICALLNIAPGYARRLLHRLAERGVLQPCSGHLRVRSYMMSRPADWLWV